MTSSVSATISPLERSNQRSPTSSRSNTVEALVADGARSLLAKRSQVQSFDLGDEARSVASQFRVDPSTPSTTEVSLADFTRKLRSPLATIDGDAKALRECLGNLDQADGRMLACETAASICESSLSLLNVLTKLQEWSDLQSAASSINVEHVRLDELLARVEKQMRPQAEAKGLKLVTQILSTARIDVASDPQRLQTVLVQLIDNAIKFTSSGEVTVTVATTVLGSGAVQLSFEVRDTGGGIPADTLSQLVRRIAKADATSMRQLGGQGLGLAICRKVANLLGGTLTIASRPQFGTTVTFIAQCCDIEPSWARQICGGCRCTGEATSSCRPRDEFLSQLRAQLLASQNVATSACRRATQMNAAAEELALSGT